VAAQIVSAAATCRVPGAAIETLLAAAQEASMAGVHGAVQAAARAACPEAAEDLAEADAAAEEADGGKSCEVRRIGVRSHEDETAIRE